MIDVPSTKLARWLYIKRWNMRQRAMLKASIKVGRRVQEIEIFGDIMIQPVNILT